MGCCTTQQKPQNKQTTAKQNVVTNQAQSQPEQVAQPQNEKVQEKPWFKETQRKDAGDFLKYKVIDGQPKSSKYGGRVQVFEIQQKDPVDSKDIKLKIGTGQESDPVSQIVGAVKTISFNSGQEKDQQEAQIVYKRLFEVKEKVDKLSDDKIVKFDLDATKGEKGHFYIDIFMPFAPFGTLEDEVQRRIKSNKNYFKSEEVLGFIEASLKAFQLLQDQNIQHMDIKPQNFLLLESSNIKDAKISDFRPVPDYISAFPNQASEHFEYTAPKLRENSQDVNHQVYKSDLFSLGLTWLRVATLWDVSGINTEKDVKQRLESLNMIKDQEKYSSLIVQMITKALTFDENSRPDFVHFESPLQSNKLAQQNPTLLKVIKNKKLITDRLEKKHDSQVDNYLSNNIQRISLNQSQQIFSYLPAGDEEEHREDDQSVAQSILELKNQHEALLYGGQFISVKNSSLKNQTDQVTVLSTKESEKKNTAEEKATKETMEAAK